jgi:hypothetical protein
MAHTYEFEYETRLWNERDESVLVTVTALSSDEIYICNVDTGRTLDLEGLPTEDQLRIRQAVEEHFFEWEATQGFDAWRDSDRAYDEWVDRQAEEAQTKK